MNSRTSCPRWIGPYAADFFHEARQAIGIEDPERSSIMLKHIDVNGAATPKRRAMPARRASGERRRPVVNITPLERAGRVLVGAIGAVGGALLFASAGGALTTVLAGLLVLAGLDLVVTGALGHCPLYKKLGYVPPSLRGSA